MLNLKAMKYVTSDVVSSDGSLANKGNIDWNDFNYPICLKIYHFDANQTPQIHRRRVFLFRFVHILVIISMILNLTTNIINSATGVENGGLRIGLSVFLLLFWIPISFQLFFYPYHIIMKEEGRAIIYYVLGIITIIFFSIWCIADFADANGFVMVDKNFKAERSVAAIFGLVTALFMLGIAIISCANLFLFYRR